MKFRTKREARLAISDQEMKALREDVLAVESSEMRSRARHLLKADNRRKEAARIRDLLHTLPE